MPEWSTDTRDLVAATIAAHVDNVEPHPDGVKGHAIVGCHGCHFAVDMPSTEDWDGPLDAFEAHRADAVLTALTEAGALLPAGGQPGSGDWRIVYGGRTGDIVWNVGLTALSADRSLEHARHSWPNARKQRRATTSWPDGSVYYGPWQEVPDA